MCSQDNGVNCWKVIQLAYCLRQRCGWTVSDTDVLWETEIRLFFDFRRWGVSLMSVLVGLAWEGKNIDSVWLFRYELFWRVVSLCIRRKMFLATHSNYPCRHLKGLKKFVHVALTVSKFPRFEKLLPIFIEKFLLSFAFLRSAALSLILRFRDEYKKTADMFFFLRSLLPAPQPLAFKFCSRYLNISKSSWEHFPYFLYHTFKSENNFQTRLWAARLRQLGLRRRLVLTTPILYCFTSNRFWATLSFFPSGQKTFNNLFYCSAGDLLRWSASGEDLKKLRGKGLFCAGLESLSEKSRL